jgi:hypothetical protein
VGALETWKRNWGGPVTTLKAFFEAGKKIISFGAAANASSREDIRSIVGQLSDELDRALMLADSYLTGVQYSRDDQELAQYLQSVNGKLAGSYHEHHVCAGLYQLADKFGQVFDPTRFSVSINSYKEIPMLISHLKSGERAVLDELDDTTHALQKLAAELSKASPATVDAVKLDISNTVLKSRSVIAKHRKKIKATRRKIVDSM